MAGEINIKKGMEKIDPNLTPLPFEVSYEFLDDSDEELRRQRVGWINVVGLLMKERNSELDFSIIKHIVFAENLPQTVHKIERIKEKRLPLERYFADHRLVFMVLDGADSLLVVSSSADPFGNEEEHRGWYFLLGAELAKADYYRRLYTTKLGDPSEGTINLIDGTLESVSSEMMASYRGGYFGRLPELAARYPFMELATEIGNTRRMMEFAREQYESDKDLMVISDRFISVTKRLATAMTQLLGYIDNAEADGIHVQTDDLLSLQKNIRLLGAQKMWNDISIECRNLFSSREILVGVKSLQPLAEAWWEYLQSLGLTFTLEGLDVRPCYTRPNQSPH